MSKKEALKALYEGKKVRHRYFSDEEYLETDGYTLIAYKWICLKLLPRIIDEWANQLFVKYE